MNEYKRAIDIVTADSVEWRALVLEIAKSNPGVLVAADDAINGPESQPWYHDVRALMQARDKVAAIKLYRSHTGYGLKESKQFVESIRL